ncbi:hypothetical protein FHL15_002577 [Xylaria flabelliformis]|uniref:2EXR domain-containing protein n=1 Tax=Xylaria flabelliformis TaxID=2512241 RepID=A0A553I7X7_9PEZI|nr:hypothetical protein FHL15_002577 [Xylaria flabelliformis]
MSETTFPQFRRLPCELRQKVWAEYALPRGPMVHSISYSGNLIDNFLLCSFSFDCDGVDPYSQVNVYHLATTRALMQVNYEARKTVLVGRQLQRVISSDHFSIEAFHGGGSRLQDYLFNSSRWRRYRLPHGVIYHKFFFVNWDIDLFYFRSGIHNFMDTILEESCLQKMQRIAVEIRGPKVKNGGLYAPSYTTFFDPWKCTGSPVSPHLLASVKIISLVLTYKAARKIYQQHLIEHHNREPDTEPSGDIEEYKEATGTGLEPSQIGECDYQKWARCIPREGKYGFVDHSQFFNRPLTRLALPGDVWETPLISLEDWIDEMISKTEGDARENFCGRPVDIRMFVDIDGRFDYSISKKCGLQFGVSRDNWSSEVEWNFEGVLGSEGERILV